ncbi:MurR/RpiR family transcriptional regulator [Dongia soli]|uniref:MurR/RpiR family transcriptional regulator n=1 Tax=Dongia soli TaxID=600628 RepID=A0ABU5EHX2_9PROT|nr:MurR/RpiR family transcriptional regulator [Dongia soli]MDY0884976.1 MurR/RpiR family transcriptional regulator [Dongia soli]
MAVNQVGRDIVDVSVLKSTSQSVVSISLMEAKTKNPISHPAAIEPHIRALLPSLTPSEKRVARAILAAYPIAALGTIAELSERAGASAPTILRLTTKLGFEGYSHFQKVVQEEIQQKMQSPLSLLESAPRMPPARRGFLGGFFDDLVEALQKTNSLLQPSVLDEAIDLLADPSRKVYAIGGRSSHVLAKYLVFHLHLLRPQVQEIANSSVPVYHQAADLGRGALVVAFDFRRYERQTIEFCQHAAKRGAKLILMTDPWLSPIAELAQIVLPVEVDVPSPFDSSIVAMAVVEACLAGALARLDDTARARMAKLDELTGRDKVIGAETVGGGTRPKPSKQGAT